MVYTDADGDDTATTTDDGGLTTTDTDLSRVAPDYRRYADDEVPEGFEFSINPDNPEEFPDDLEGEWTSPEEDFNPEDVLDSDDSGGDSGGNDTDSTGTPDPQYDPADQPSAGLLLYEALAGSGGGGDASDTQPPTGGFGGNTALLAIGGAAVLGVALTMRGE